MQGGGKSFPPLLSPVSLTERSDAPICDVLLSRQPASLLSREKRTWLEQYRVGQPMLLMGLKNILE